jgi:hypothetical protein
MKTKTKESAAVKRALKMVKESRARMNTYSEGQRKWLEKQARAMINPEFKPLSNYGDLFTIDDFLDMVRCGGVTDWDGSGSWATKTQQSNVDINFATILKNDPPKWATHVIWFNK